MARGRHPKINTQALDDAISDYHAHSIHRYEAAPFVQRVRELSSNLSVYDAHYVALAEWLDAPLLTSDSRIQRANTTRCEIDVVS